MHMIEKLAADINKEIRALAREVKRDKVFSGASKQLYLGINDFMRRPGKRIRPILFMLVYLGYTQKRKINRKKLLRSALSFELLHDFFLVHDDIIDSSTLRRGKPTLHEKLAEEAVFSKNPCKIGRDLAIVAGDVMFALAVKLFFSIDEEVKKKEQAFSMFSDLAVSTGAGEYLDIVTGERNIDDVKESDIIKIYDLKTAKYTFVGPMVIGASMAGAGNTEIEGLENLGLCLGQAFQIADDLIDVFFSSTLTKKTFLSDLAESKRTLLVYKACKEMKGKDKKEFKILFDKTNKTKKDLAHMRMLISRTNALEYCVKKAKDNIKKAISILDLLRIKGNEKDGIRNITSKLSSNLKKIQ